LLLNIDSIIQNLTAEKLKEDSDDAFDIIKRLD